MRFRFNPPWVVLEWSVYFQYDSLSSSSCRVIWAGLYLNRLCSWPPCNLKFIPFCKRMVFTSIKGLKSPSCFTFHNCSISSSRKASAFWTVAPTPFCESRFISASNTCCSRPYSGEAMKFTVGLPLAELDVPLQSHNERDEGVRQIPLQSHNERGEGIRRILLPVFLSNF